MKIIVKIFSAIGLTSLFSSSNKTVQHDVPILKAGPAASGWVMVLFLLVLAGFPAVQADPGLRGSRPVANMPYSGDMPLMISGITEAIEVAGFVHYPSDLASGGRHPLIIILQGRFSTCFDPVTGILKFPPLAEWPCPDGYDAVAAHRGYDGLASLLASHGYIVASIQADDLASKESINLGAVRADLIHHHLGEWFNFDTVGGSSVGSIFVDRVDLDRVGLIGHSLGGAGVAHLAQALRPIGTPYQIRGVFVLAPAGESSALPVTRVPLAVMLPYCDGNLIDLPGARYFDVARYALAGDLAPKHMIMLMNANHNFFNERFEPPPVGVLSLNQADDWLARNSDDSHCASFPPRLEAPAQRAVSAAYIAAFFRVYIGREMGFAPILTGESSLPPSYMLSPDEVLVTYQAPDHPLLRRDLNRQLSPSDLLTNNLGGAVTTSGPTELSPFEHCIGSACLPGVSSTRVPHSRLGQLKLGWSDFTGWYQNELPPGTGDLLDFSVLQFRVGVDFEDERNAIGVDQDFSVTLIDGLGGASTVAVAPYARGALTFPPGQTILATLAGLPRLLANGLRIPLRDFTSINRRDVRALRFDFDREAQGALLFSDIAFSSGYIPVPRRPDVYDLSLPYNDDLSSPTSLDPLLLVDEFDPIVLDEGSGWAEDRVLWRAAASGLNLHDEDDVDFFEFTLPDPVDAYPGVLPVPDSECGSLSFTARFFDGSMVTDTVIFEGRLSINPRVLPASADETLGLYHDADSSGDYDPSEITRSSAGLSIRCPRSDRGMLGQLMVSYGERTEPRIVYPEYDLSVAYRIDILRIPGVPDWVRNLTRIEQIAPFPCLDGSFPGCVNLDQEEIHFDMEHPQIPPFELCAGADQSCTDQFAFKWDSKISLLIDFVSDPNMSFTLLDADQQKIAQAVIIDQVPPPQEQVSGAQQLSGIALQHSEDVQVTVLQRLQVSELAAGLYVLTVSGPVSSYSVRFESPPPALDSDNDGVSDSFDPCPADAEDFDGFRDVDGCPDLKVEIDIKPDSATNSINPSSKGVIPVAILSSETFDATSVSLASVEFGPARAQPLLKKPKRVDVNADGLPDLLLHFQTSQTGISCGDQAIRLTAMNSPISALLGTDNIRTLPCR